MALPQEFRVGAAVRSAHGGGKLTVSPGTLSLRLGPLMRRYTGIEKIVQSGAAPVVIMTGRLMPPFLNTRIALRDGGTVGHVSLPGWSRRRLRVALEEAGLQVQERSGWFLGGG